MASFQRPADAAIIYGVAQPGKRGVADARTAAILHGSYKVVVERRIER